MARTTSTPNAQATARRRPWSRRAGRLVQAAVIVGVLLAAGSRALAAPVGAIDGPGATGAPAAAVAATVEYVIDSGGAVGSVVVLRHDDQPDQSVTVELADGGGAVLASVTTVLHGPRAIVALPAPVSPARVGFARIHA
jgi:hypothetical protein